MKEKLIIPRLGLALADVAALESDLLAKGGLHQEGPFGALVGHNLLHYHVEEPFAVLFAEIELQEKLGDHFLREFSELGGLQEGPHEELEILDNPRFLLEGEDFSIRVEALGVVEQE